MASWQVEIASSSPFGCVLRDRNQIDGCRESNVFQLKMKNFIKDHLNISKDSKANENNNNAFKASKKNNLGSLHFMRTNHNNNNKDKDESWLASLISPRHSRLLDRWAARQTREMVSNLENEAELLAMPNSNNNNNEDSDMLPRTYSNSSFGDVSSETTTLGASSLVQIWEKRLNKSNRPKSSTQVSTNASSLEEQNSGGSEAGESSNSSDDRELPGNEEPFPDWESYKISQSYQSSPQERSSSLESAESDRVSVADIIKRLSSTKQGQSPPHSIGEENGNEGGSTSVTFSPCTDREFGFATELSENKAFLPQITCLPRIRGRRAFHDLLIKFVCDRYVEINILAERGAVSKFTRRGRIQSVLWLRLLQRGVVASNQSHHKSIASEVNRKEQGSSIMQLREIFNTGVDNRTTMQIEEVAEPRSHPTQFDASTTANELREDTCRLIVNKNTDHSPKSEQKSVSQTSVDDHNNEEAQPCSDTTSQETCLEAQHVDSKETAEAIPSMTESNVNEMESEVEASNQEYTMAETSYDETVDEDEEACNEHYAESSYSEIVEEVEDIDMNYDENSYDWISEISRPRSYWEERRQEWYREMLDTESHKEDICKLLERRTVSTFLSSDFRDKMDRLMKSHRGVQTHLVSRQDEEEDNQVFVSFLQECLHPASSPQADERERVDEQEEEEEAEPEDDIEEESEEDIEDPEEDIDEEPEEDNIEEEEEEEEEEEKVEEHEGERLISNSDHEVCDYFNQSTSPTHLTTWSYKDNETGDDFDRVASMSLPPSQSESFCEESRRNSSSTDHHSIEMELMYDMRGRIEQLHQEISELRKSMMTCMDMKMQLQQCKNQEVHIVKKEEKKSHNLAPKKGNCCICYDMKVDALLYRCGHMCTCLKCANELQWNCGKCPICRAKIVDVVRVYVDF
ncbi:putative aminoacyltransferase, E1 ubiquitin-activating enzyme [Lupinus albus]|uniref:Putative aminoacyltransferase, E1 ubiquitin-activating enzyme n=1 Tax=Lupinus albus TaxID=3870 RepID=A0A6A4P263_LUPAL|nr:putative aminoacyltransferase, E1 ubiquitin-activating enzyme [Lupinus albus]